MSDITKLPKWAREKIESQERHIANLKDRIQELNMQHPGSNIELGSYIYGECTLPPDSEVGFYLSESRRKYQDMITVNHERGERTALSITAHSGLLVVKPWASNVIKVSIEGR